MNSPLSIANCMSPKIAAAILSVAAATACQPASEAVAPTALPATPAIPVAVHAVQPQTLTRSVSAVGTLQSNESTIITAELSGRIVEVAFREGERLDRSALLFRLDDAIARAEWQQAQANLTLAQRSHARARELVARQLVSQTELDQADATKAVAEAAVALAQARVDKHRITAPFEGVAGLRQVSPGAYVNPGDPLVPFEALHPMKVEFRVPETVLADLQAGQKVDVTLDAFPGEVFSATVYAVAAGVSEASRSVAVRALIDNEHARLRPGLFARIRLDLETREDAVVVPEAAVFPRGDSARVYQVVEGKAREVEVVLGQRQPGVVEIIQGLAVGDTVITSGLQKVSDGAAVQPDT